MVAYSNNISFYNVSVNATLHLAANINLRYVGGFVGVADTIKAINCNSYVKITHKHVGNGEVIGFVNGGLVGKV